MTAIEATRELIEAAKLIQKESESCGKIMEFSLCLGMAQQIAGLVVWPSIVAEIATGIEAAIDRRFDNKD